eukprot:TRINITY_DN57_c0_g1_i1.p1 TRINITY_DN57_c0_g1~~TRINITY_DN57_c0_g1_i1.p1  ORF type:complete len:193 (-),score=74.94 TRINITY_DN57_c0_g1_i1:75-653(-)
MGNGLSSKELKELTKETKLSKGEIQKKYKEFQVKYPSGKLDMVTFLWESKAAFGGTPKFWENVFASLDRDHSGEVDFRDYLIALSIAGGDSEENKLKLSFSMYDLDKNGTIEKDEFGQIISIIVQMGGLSNNKDLIQGKTTEELTESLFKTLDENGDGKIQLEEWIKVGQENEEIRKILSGYLAEGLLENKN